MSGFGIGCASIGGAGILNDPRLYRVKAVFDYAIRLKAVYDKTMITHASYNLTAGAAGVFDKKDKAAAVFDNKKSIHIEIPAEA